MSWFLCVVLLVVSLGHISRTSDLSFQRSRLGAVYNIYQSFTHCPLLQYGQTETPHPHALHSLCVWRALWHLTVNRKHTHTQVFLVRSEQSESLQPFAGLWFQTHTVSPPLGVISAAGQRRTAGKWLGGPVGPRSRVLGQGPPHWLVLLDQNCITWVSVVLKHNLC